MFLTTKRRCGLEVPCWPLPSPMTSSRDGRPGSALIVGKGSSGLNAGEEFGRPDAESIAEPEQHGDGRRLLVVLQIRNVATIHPCRDRQLFLRHLGCRRARFSDRANSRKRVCPSELH